MLLLAATFSIAQDIVRMGVLLPFSGTEVRTQKMTEFYRGILMAADSMTASGCSVDIVALDCGTTDGEMQRTIETNEAALKACDFIIGPQSPSQVQQITTFCHKYGVRLVVPFTDLPQQQAAENVFVVSTAERERSPQGALLFMDLFRNCNVVRMNGLGDKDGLGGVLVEQCRRNGVKVGNIDVEYTEQQMAQAIDTTAHTVVIVGTGGLNEINRVMATLDAFSGAHPTARISVLGGYEWQNFVQQHLHNFYKYDTYIPVTHFHNALSASCVGFENRYMRQFGVQMVKTSPRFAPMGFDVAWFFLQAVARWGTEGTLMEENLEQMYRQQRPLQHSLCFQWSGTGCWINRSCRFVHYSADRQIQLLTR